MSARDLAKPTTLRYSNEVADLANDPRREQGGLKPRAERFPIRTPLRYRESGQTAWSRGTTVNISRSGVLFSAEKELLPKTMLELRILFPAEISAGTPANVICWGPVVRAERPNSPDQQPALAVAIRSYRFTRDESGDARLKT